MDAIVGESYVSRTHSDRNAAESDEITGRATRKKRTNAPGSGAGQSRTNYGVSESLAVHSDKRYDESHGNRLFFCRELTSGN